MKTTNLKKTSLKAAMVLAIALAFIMPSATAFTSTTTPSAVGVNTNISNLKFQKATQPAPLGRGTDVLVAGDAGNENTPAIVKDGNGNLWVFYVFDDGVDPNIYMRESTDNGATWSAAWYLPVDSVQTTPVATVDSTGMIWVAFIDLGTDTQYFLEAQDPSVDPTSWTWQYFTPTTQQVANHNCGGIATYQTDRTIAAFTYIADIVYPPYSVPTAAVVSHNGASATQWTFTWDSTWNGRPATYSSIASTSTLFFFAFQYTNTTLQKEIINVRWGDAVAQNDMEQWKNQWGMWETPATANCVEPAVGASGTNAIVVYQTDAAGNQDIMCSFTGDNGATWTHGVTVVNSASDEINPRVFMAGTSAYCLYTKEGNIFLVTSTDGGATWGAPAQINDVAGTVVTGWHMTDISYPNIAWTDSRGTDQDIYFDTGGAPPAVPHLTITSVTGGVGVSATVTNDGNGNATNLMLTIKVTGGILHKVNVDKTGSAPVVAPAGSFTYKTGLFLGLGAISISVSASCDEGATASETHAGKILLFYVKI